jgi:hypothetical protein
MRTLLTLTVLTALAAPVSAQSDSFVRYRTSTSQSSAQAERERQRELQQQERERQQQERERQREREQQDRERAQREREQARERAQREREQAQERAQRERERQRGQCAPQQVERITRTLKLGNTGELDLANIAGDIVITRASGNEVALDIVKTACGRTDDDAREMLKLVQVEIVERGGRAEVRTHYPEGDEMRRNNRRNFNVSVAYTVVAPAGTRIRAHSISGSISAKDIKGELSLDSVSGTISVANGGRVAAAKSISGNVEVTETDMDTAFGASSASGNILLRRVKARQLDVGSISGSVILDDVDCPRVEAQSVSGEVRFGGPIARGARYELTSHSGSVQVTVAGGAGFEVEATSFSGTVRSDLPLTTRGADFPGRRNRSLRGVFGDGSAVLELTTFSGNILISKR